MKKYLLITVTESGYVVTVDTELITAAAESGNRMHGFHTIDAAVAFVSKQLHAKRGARDLLSE